MIRLKLTAFLVALLSFLQSNSQKTKHALIFAIGDYPPAGGWSKLASINDTVHIRTALQRKGFVPSDIKTLVNAQVTIRGITDALNQLIANPRVKAGDVVLVHFSTHGEQVKDQPQGDETDNLDETIVTYNAKVPEKVKDFNKEQAEYFRDDAFGALINQLRAKLGREGDVVVLMDLCHSGSATRGRRVRGGKPPLVPSPSDLEKSAKDTSGVFVENTGMRGGDESTLASYVVISSARAEESSFETLDENYRDVGSLSYAVSKVFETLEQKTTYRSLFSKIQVEMNKTVPGQHPVLEGNGVDRTLFGGDFVWQKPYVEIEGVNGKEVTVGAGLFAGLDSGAKVKLYNHGTPDPSKETPLDSGKVTDAGMYKATVTLSKEFERAEKSAWVFVTDPVYNTKPINVGIERGRTGGGAAASGGFSQTEVNGMRDSIRSLPLFRLTGEPELLLVKGGAKDSIFVASSRYLFDTITNMSSNAAELQKRLQNYAQYRFLHDLEIKEPNVNVVVKLVPLINGKPDTTKISSKNVHGVTEFKEGEKFVLWVKNPGTKAVYFNILDMQPDGKINPVLPNRRPLSGPPIYASDLRIEADSSRLFDKYIVSVESPYGTEVFKVFAATDAIDLEMIARSRGAKSRGNFGVLERLVKKSYDTATRGVNTSNLGGANGSCYNIPFVIKSK